MRPILIALVLAAAWPAFAADDPGEKLFRSNCGGCHELALAVGQRNTPAQWRAIVDEMANRGAPGSDADLAEVRNYLIRLHGRIEINKLSAEALTQHLRLPPVQAQAIVKRRTSGGPFRTYDDLVATAGVEAARLAPYRQSLVF